jgi:hypothetical protein
MPPGSARLWQPSSAAAAGGGAAAADRRLLLPSSSAPLVPAAMLLPPLLPAAFLRMPCMLIHWAVGNDMNMSPSSLQNGYAMSRRHVVIQRPGIAVRQLLQGFLGHQACFLCRSSLRFCELCPVLQLRHSCRKHGIWQCSGRRYNVQYCRVCVCIGSDRLLRHHGFLHSHKADCLCTLDWQRFTTAIHHMHFDR